MQYIHIHIHVHVHVHVHTHIHTHIPTHIPTQKQMLFLGQAGVGLMNVSAETGTWGSRMYCTGRAGSNSRHYRKMRTFKGPFACYVLGTAPPISSPERDYTNGRVYMHIRIHICLFVHIFISFISVIRVLMGGGSIQAICALLFWQVWEDFR